LAQWSFIYAKGSRDDMTTILLFSRDLRLTDNPALAAAIARNQPIVPVFILDDEDAGDWAPGAASRWWLHGALAALGEDLGQRGSRLILRRGKAEAVLDQLLPEIAATGVYWNRRYEPWAKARSERLKKRLAARGIDAQSFNAGLIHEPWTLRTQKGEPYRVFTPFWKALRTAGVKGLTLLPPPRLPAPTTFPRSDILSQWALRPTKPDWAGGLRSAWTPGEQGAHERLQTFAERAAFGYRDGRNIPGVEGTSRLSPHLHFGEIGPRQIWRALTVQAVTKADDPMPGGVETFLSEIAWREFSYHLLFHFPTLPNEPLRQEFGVFPWVGDAAALSAWQRGMTGYPIVDAGMRELWTTGWMHNRVRMIVASFLVKDLLGDWRQGEAWFWDTLVDADLANNSASWQWVSGCGADAAPYFRVFNPSLQGAKFDPEGSYVRRWVPELARLPDALLHAPWKAQPIELADAGVRLGTTYPRPIVDHSTARNRALAAFKALKASSLPGPGFAS
jgi:deoxyribodipyrimidine photo-lyase